APACAKKHVPSRREPPAPPRSSVFQPPGRKAMALKRGVPVSPGVAVARAYCVDEVLAPREPAHLDRSALSGEIARFDRACAAAVRELDAITERVGRQIGEEEAAIFRAHRLLLRDPALVAKVHTAILDQIGRAH